MISLLVRFVLLVIVAAAFAWLAEQPGNLTLRWLGHEIETSLMAAAVFLFAIGLILWITWSVIMWLLDRPGAFGGWFKSRREKKGREALSSGLIAVAAGDKDAAQTHAKTAAAILGGEPMARLLDAQAAQMRGDSGRVSQLFEEMAQSPETRLLGLRGLHTEAVRQSDMKRARALAEEAARINPKVPWASQAVLSYHSANEDWPAIGRTIDQQRSAKLINKAAANHKHAVVLTAQAQTADGKNTDDAGELALKAHKLDPSLVPAALIAARHTALAGSLRKASKILEKTWNQTPHPDIAEAYAHLRSGDSAQDRLKRVKALVGKSGGIEGAVALATAAIEALEWKAARDALAPYAHDRPQARICGLMAEIEEGEFGDKGRAREWLARAVRAPRDPAWTADGFISRTWLPVSPVSGELGVFKWKVPVEGIAYEDPGLGAADTADADVIPGDDAVPVAAEEHPKADTDTEPEAKAEAEAEPDEAPEEVELAETADTVAAENDEAGTENTDNADAGEADPDSTDETAGVAEEPASQRDTGSPAESEPAETASDEAADMPRQPDDPGPDASKPKEKSGGWL